MGLSKGSAQSLKFGIADCQQQDFLGAHDVRQALCDCGRRHLYSAPRFMCHVLKCRFGERDDARSTPKQGSGLVESNVTVSADTEHLQLNGFVCDDLPELPNRFGILRVIRRWDDEADCISWQTPKERVAQFFFEPPRMAWRQPDVLVEHDPDRTAEVDFFFCVQSPKDFVRESRRLPGCEPDTGY